MKVVSIFIIIAGLMLFLSSGAGFAAETDAQEQDSSQKQTKAVEPVEDQAKEVKGPLKAPAAGKSDWTSRVRERRLNELERQLLYEKARHDEMTEGLGAIVELAELEGATDTAAELKKFLVKATKRWEGRTQAMEKKRDSIIAYYDKRAAEAKEAKKSSREKASSRRSRDRDRSRNRDRNRDR